MRSSARFIIATRSRDACFGREEKYVVALSSGPNVLNVQLGHCVDLRNFRLWWETKLDRLDEVLVEEWSPRRAGQRWMRTRIQLSLGPSSLCALKAFVQRCQSARLFSRLIHVLHLLTSFVNFFAGYDSILTKLRAHAPLFRWLILQVNAPFRTLLFLEVGWSELWGHCSGNSFGH